MNFLALCKRVGSESGITSNFTTVTNQTGALNKIVEWVRLAALDIEISRVDWKFHFETLSSTLEADRKIFLEGDLGVNDINNVLNVIIDGIPTDFIEWDEYTALYRANAKSNDTASSVTAMTRAPSGKFYVYPVPTRPLSIELDYSRVPTELINSTDVPVIPSRYHEAIVQRALMFFAEDSEDFNRLATARENYKTWMNLLNRDQRPNMVFS